MDKYVVIGAMASIVMVMIAASAVALRAEPKPAQTCPAPSISELMSKMEAAADKASAQCLGVTEADLESCGRVGETYARDVLHGVD